MVWLAIGTLITVAVWGAVVAVAAGARAATAVPPSGTVGGGGDAQL